MATGEANVACCQPLAWVDDQTVLLRTEREGLVTWNVFTGALAAIGTGPLGAAVAVSLD